MILKILIFDYDGTIIKRDNQKILKNILKINDKELIKNILKKLEREGNIKTSLEKSFLESGIKKTDSEIREYAKKYTSAYEDGKIKKNVKEMLKRLSKKYKLILLSNGSKRIKIKELKKNKIFNFFEEIITQEDTLYAKPDERAFKYILKKYKIPAEECVSIGNSLSFDLIPAKKLGMKIIWIFEEKIDKVLTDVSELNYKDINKLK